MEKSIESANVELWNSRGLNVLSPREVGLQYVSDHRLGARLLSLNGRGGRCVDTFD